MVLPRPVPSLCAGWRLPQESVSVPQEDLPCQRFVLLRVLKVRSGNFLVVSENFRVVTEEMMERSLVLVRVVLPGYCCSLGTFLRLGLGLMFCCTQGSRNRSL